MKRGKSELPRLINCLSDRGSLNLPTHVLLWQCKVTKERSLRNATPTFRYVRVYALCRVIDRGRLNVPTHTHMLTSEGKVIKERILRNAAMFRVSSLTVTCVMQLVSICM